MRSVINWGVVGLAVVLAAVGVARPDEEKIALDKLPKAVLEAVKAKYPDAVLVGAEQETEDGKTVYEIQIKNKDQKLEVTFKPDGTLTTVEKEIEIKALPKEVAEALDAKYPKATLEKAEEVTEGDKVTYEVRLTTADKKSLEVELDPKGKILEVEEKSKEKSKEKNWVGVTPPASTTLIRGGSWRPLIEVCGRKDLFSAPRFIHTLA